MLDNEGGEHRLLLGRTDSAVDASLALHHANAPTILDDTEVGAALPTPVAPAALHELAQFLNHEVRLQLATGAGEAQAAWVERELVAPLVRAADLRGLCEGAAFLGTAAVQRACVAELARVVEDCRTAEEVRELFGIRTQSSSTVTDFFAAGFLHYSPTEDVQIQAVESTKARAVRRPA